LRWATAPREQSVCRDGVAHVDIVAASLKRTAPHGVCLAAYDPRNLSRKIAKR
jgi:hypothetical protein